MTRFFYVQMFYNYLNKHTGFPIKDASFSKLKNIPSLLIDDNQGKIEENIDEKYFKSRACFLGNPV